MVVALEKRVEKKEVVEEDVILAGIEVQEKVK